MPRAKPRRWWYIGTVRLRSPKECMMGKVLYCMELWPLNYSVRVLHAKKMSSLVDPADCEAERLTHRGPSIGQINAERLTEDLLLVRLMHDHERTSSSSSSKHERTNRQTDSSDYCSNEQGN